MKIRKVLDYFHEMKKTSSSKAQAVVAEPGNNGTVETSLGQADVGDGSYATGMKKSK